MCCYAAYILESSLNQIWQSLVCATLCFFHRDDVNQSKIKYQYVGHLLNTMYRLDTGQFTTRILRLIVRKAADYLTVLMQDSDKGVSAPPVKALNHCTVPAGPAFVESCFCSLCRTRRKEKPQGDNLIPCRSLTSGGACLLVLTQFMKTVTEISSSLKVRNISDVLLCYSLITLSRALLYTQG